MEVRVMKRKDSKSLNKMMKHLKKITDTKIDMGYFKDSGVHSEGMSYAELMNIHEYGIDVPSRPLLHIASDMIRSNITMQNYSAPIKRFIGSYEGSDVNTETIGSEMRREGSDIFGDSQLLLPNSPNTNNPEHPLEDTGELKANLGSRVNGGGVNKQ